MKHGFSRLMLLMLAVAVALVQGANPLAASRGALSAAPGVGVVGAIQLGPSSGAKARVLAISAPRPRGWAREPAYGETKEPLATTEFEGGVYVFAKRPDNRIFLQKYNPGSRLWLSKWIEVPGGGLTEAALAVTTAGDRLYLFAKGYDRHVWVNTKKAGGTPTDGWSGWFAERPPPGTTRVPVTAAGAKDGSVSVFRRGDDGYIYASQRLAGGWSAWEPVSLYTDEQAPTATYDAYTGTLSLFGIYKNAVYMRTRYAGTWRGPRKVQGAWGSVESAVSVAAAGREGSLTVFYRSGDGRIYGSTYNGDYFCDRGTWSSPVEVGGFARTNKAPALASFAFKAGAGGRFMLLVNGLDDGIWFNVVTALRIQAVKVSDDDGKLDAAISPAEVTQWVDYANRVYAPADIRLVFNPAVDFSAPAQTKLNQTSLCEPTAKTPVTTNCLTRADGNSEAAKYPGKVVVLFRYGRDLDMSGMRVATGTGFSWDDYNFVAMPGFAVTTVCKRQNIMLLAHELGHYLGLWHTFPIDPTTGALFTAERASAWLTAKGGDRFAAFDDDRGSGVSDTEADPGWMVAGQCSAATAPVTVNGQTWTPPRTNVMSYYDPGVTMGVSPQQIERVHMTLLKRSLP
jgi:hypothetical protein